jgi:hypothetical protein
MVLGESSLFLPRWLKAHGVESCIDRFNLFSTYLKIVREM